MQAGGVSVASQPVPGILIHWINGPSNNVGLVTEVIQAGSRLRVAFDHGEEKIFAWPNSVVERLVFPEGTYVAVHGHDDIGRVESFSEIEGTLIYSLILGNGEVTMAMEAGVRRATITDPMKLA